MPGLSTQMTLVHVGASGRFMALHIAKVTNNGLALKPHTTHVSTNKRSLRWSIVKYKVNQASASINLRLTQILLVAHRFNETERTDLTKPN